ncbi:MAG: ATP-binding cassette domain-containing protein, partial [Clostridia bacterium]|nr:ATP-binding cassette domain-containing protein [Clostridia bacterium]
MDTEAYAYIQEYLYFNGKSVKEINADTSLGAINWEYTQFPGNASDKYKVPVLIYERDAARLRLYIHENYFNALGANPTFEIKEGSVYGLVGSNGSGKSTLLRLISGVYMADEGHIGIDGEAVFDNPQ